MMKIFLNIGIYLFLLFMLTVVADAQTFQRELSAYPHGKIDVVNRFGRVSVVADKEQEQTVLTVENGQETEVSSVFTRDGLEIRVSPSNPKTRIDLSLKIPERMRLRVETSDGEVRIAGNLETADVRTDTGTIATDVPLDDLRYNFVWTSSRPRFLSDIELAEVKEKAAGKFVLKGKIFEGRDLEGKKAEKKEQDSADEDQPVEEPKEKKKKKGRENPAETDPDATGDGGGEEAEMPVSKKMELDFSTARGIILLNVNPGSVPSDLRERPLTEAAKAIIRSGDSILMDAIRRASPKYFGDYSKTLPPYRSEPSLSERPRASDGSNGRIKKVLVKVTDLNNRAIPDLRKEDFDLTERGEEREILSVEPTTSSFNLVLLIDVSGSVDNYVNFIRKAARNFVNTVDKNDRVAIIIFNEDIKVLSNFTTDKGKLSESLDTFDAGGGTAYFDALAFTLAETLRPLKGERTGIVVLSDGDDTRSFLPFDALLGAIQESGALVYPLYVPTALIAASKNLDPNESVDPLRNRYMGLTSKAETEGEKLAEVSGGVYYPISQLDQLQKAYDDIVVQLRTAYSITFRSDLAELRDGRASPRLKVRVKRENAFVKLGSVVEVSPTENAELEK
ncbi:MAG: VWA domain-containing protein [Pyrinomonadaceae bacterium]